jgi:cytochrome b
MADAVMEASPAVKVWSPFVRIFHWSLVASVATAWVVAEDWRSLHEVAGYVAAGLVAWRLVAGLGGSHFTRFAQFVRGPGTVMSYLGDVAAGRERRYLGHNPAGGLMVLALIACLSLIALTGWMQTTDTYFGVSWVENVHQLVGNAIVFLVGLHVSGVVLASLRHHENLVRAMVTGRKRAPAADDVA